MEASGAAVMCDADDSPTPDSTTRERILFSEGEDVLVRNKDGRFYLGTVVQLDMQSGCCLVEFLDNTQVWSPFHQVTRLSTPETDLLCVVCKSSTVQPDNNVIACEKCSRGYHRLCHQPAIAATVAGRWHCHKCRKPGRKKKDLKLRHSSPVSSVKEVVRCPSASSSSSTSAIQRLPYDLNALCWDFHHRTNEEDCYCYCGGPGLWFMQMLQCAHCRQWFHQNCVKCLHYPVYCGDRFYVFICSVCNNGSEFLRRFELKWVDIVHLALFNMTVFFAKKYFDLDSEILPYVNGNAFSLQLPTRITNSSLDTMRECILQELVNNENRFKCGKEIKKRTTIWGLRLRVPPTAHNLTLPKTRPMTDGALRQFWLDSPSLNYIPMSSAPLMEMSDPPSVYHRDGVFRVFDLSVMMGPLAAAEFGFNRSGRTTVPGLRLLHVEIPGVAVPSSPGRICIKSSDNIGHGGYVNKCASHLAPNKLTLQQSLLRQKLHAMGVRPKRKHFFKRSKSLSLPEDKKGVHRAASDRRSYSADSKAPSLKKEQTASDPASCEDSHEDSGHDAEDSRDDSRDDSAHEEDSRDGTSQDDRKNAVNTVKLPPTPPSSVSAPGTPQPPSASPGDTSDSGGADIAPTQTPTTTPAPALCLSIAKLLGSPLIPESSTTPAPAPAPGTSTATVETQPAPQPVPTVVESIGLPLPLTRLLTQSQPQPPLRAVKRKLSEKDIRIDRNGDVKRRRVRRSRSGLRSVQLDSGERLETRLVGGKLLRSPLKTPSLDLSASASVSPSVAPPLPPPESEPAVALRPPTLTPPPCASPPTVQVSMEAIKKSVNCYFGAMNRIASGEKYLIKGKRTTPCGRTQYLIEWTS